MGAVETPHLRFPLRLIDGHLAVLEQDELPEVRQAVFRLLRTPRGSRPLAPLVGVDDPTFTTGVEPEVLAAELMDEENGEPRAEVTVIAGPPDQDGHQTVRVAVAVALDAEEFPDPEDSTS